MNDNTGEQTEAQQPRRMLIMEGWQKYDAAVMPRTASAEQIRETRRAIYAGAQLMMSILQGIQRDEVPEDEAAAILESISEELQTFGELVKRGVL